MNALIAVSRAIDAVNARLGKSLSWLIVVAVLISAVNALVRKFFGVSANAWLELQWVLFGAVFLLCSPWTLLANEHIRIDIVNAHFPRWLRNTIELVGHTLFLIPLCVLMLVTSWPFFLASAPSRAEFAATFSAFPAVFEAPVSAWLPNLADWWRLFLGLGEQSFNAGGLPQWPAKFLVFAGFAVLLVQAVSELIKRVAIVLGRIPDPHDGKAGHAASSFAADAEEFMAGRPTPEEVSRRARSRVS